MKAIIFEKNKGALNVDAAYVSSGSSLIMASGVLNEDTINSIYEVVNNRFVDEAASLVQDGKPKWVTAKNGKKIQIDEKTG